LTVGECEHHGDVEYADFETKASTKEGGRLSSIWVGSSAALKQRAYDKVTELVGID
jgi:hypothetical protein